MSRQFNQSDIQNSIKDIFKPESRIEVAFNLDSPVPIVLPTNIYKCDYESNRMLIYQTHPEVLPSFKFDTMNIAMLLEQELNRMIRAGLPCKIVKFVNNYQVSERLKENLFLIEYFPPMKKINLRSTFRLRTSYRYSVEATICSDDVSYASGTDFSVQDISVTGIGLLVPKKIGKRDNPMLRISVDDMCDIEVKLERAESKERPHKISTAIKVSRKVISYNPLSGFIGAVFTDLSPEDQENLFQYIHEAQLYEIRNIKGV